VSELEGSRQAFEQSLDDLRLTLDRKLGWAPKAGRWVLPLVAGASGLALAFWLTRGRRKRLPARRPPFSGR
jgi:hypothetical protein